MSAYEEIKTGLEQAIAYEKQNITDKEIKKALECCKSNCSCGGCFLKKEEYCVNVLKNLTLDYINRLEAENERLKAEVKFSDYLEYETTNQIKAEATKEFAERVKELLGVKKFGLIDNLLKEMESEEK